jgi:energy-coupling factor transport system ATP-binding protein
VVVERLTARYGVATALDGIGLSASAGEVVAVMGRNGAGKSTLLGLLAGLRAPAAGTVRVGSEAPHALAPQRLVRKVALVPADPGALLYAESVAKECAQADHDVALPPGTTAALLAQILGGVDLDTHPRDLSEGQRLALALAVVLAPDPPVLLLDEPTRGLDYNAKARLVTILRRVAAEGRLVVLATHDVELVAEVASRVIVLADGEIVADGPARTVVCHSPIFAPQVAKVLAPDEWLTVSEVVDALAS